MDGTTEPIVVVIGHPIAGNPAQFATERALRSLRLDWRVLSFDVQPRDVAAALEGFAVTGINGVIIDRSLASEAQQWYSQRTGSESTTIDCLSRDGELQFVGEFEQRLWVDEQIARHDGENRVWIGDQDSHAAASSEGFQHHATTPPEVIELVSQADVVVINHAANKPLELDAEEWPSNDGSTLVIDLSEGHQELSTIRELGYRVIGENERRIGTLQRCLNRWTGQMPSAEVIYDAIEEYLGV
jgi:hypothetical protein